MKSIVKLTFIAILFLCTPANACVGDINNDNKIDTSDLSILLSHFGSVTEGTPGDLNDDTKVNTSDLLILLSNFGSNC